MNFGRGPCLFVHSNAAAALAAYNRRTHERMTMQRCTNYFIRHAHGATEHRRRRGGHLRDCFWRRCTRWPAPPERAYEQGSYATAGIFRRQAPLLRHSPRHTEPNSSSRYGKPSKPFPMAKRARTLKSPKWLAVPKGFRAVGLANNKNPLPIVVPCHRVIGADGKLVGYAGG